MGNWELGKKFGIGGRGILAGGEVEGWGGKKGESTVFITTVIYLWPIMTNERVLSGCVFYICQ